MLKSPAYFIIAFSLCYATTSCNQQNKPRTDKSNVVKTDNYKAGDCFEFKEGIKGFGVIFLEELNYPDGKQFNLFPVRLDTTKTGIEKFKNGKVYVTSFLDYTKSRGKTEGFIVYHFLSQKDFQVINKYFSYKGSIQIKDQYKNATGGLIASNIEEFRSQLNSWDNLFNSNGRLVSVERISR